MDLTPLTEEAKEQLQAKFGNAATVVAAAPGRVNLIGEHIDYCDGLVLPVALEQNIIIAAAPNGTNTDRLATSQGDDIVEIDISGDILESDPKWANYPRGVMQYFREETGCSLTGFDAYITSNVPAGGGLSSSAAFELAVATLLEGLTGEKMGTKEKALLAQKAEHNYAHVPTVLWINLLQPLAKKGGSFSSTAKRENLSSFLLKTPTSQSSLLTPVSPTNSLTEVMPYAERTPRTD